MNTRSRNTLLISGILLTICMAILFYMTGVFGGMQSARVQQTVDSQISQYSERTHGIGLQRNSDTVHVADALGECALSLSFVSNNTQIVSGDTLTYTITLKNQSTTTCQNTSVSVYYSDNESFISSVPKPTASNYYWRLGAVLPGETRVITLSVKYIGGLSSQIETEACGMTDNGKDVCSHLSLSGSGESISIPPVVVEQPVPQPVSPVVTPDPVQQVVVTPTATSTREYGSWVWVSPVNMSSQYIDTILTGASKNGITVLYVTIDDYLDIAKMSEGSLKEQKKKAYSDALENFITLAEARGIAVDAEAGWRDWAESSQKYKAFTIVDYVINFNTTRTHKIRSLQYDVEPYLLSTYNKNKATLLKNFVQLVDETVTRLGTNPVRLSVVIPHFYDDAQKWTPSFTYNGVNTYTYNHLLRILDARPQSAIILMSYRNYTIGDNGTAEISNVEVAQASSGVHPTKVIIAQETGDVDPSFVTFFGTSKSYYLEQIGLINKTFGSYSGFGGVAVHYIDPFLQLK